MTNETVVKHVCAYAPPPRVWERTETGWTSREWLPGEKDEYAREVLGWKNSRVKSDD